MNDQLTLFPGLPDEVNNNALPLFVALGYPGKQLKFLANPNEGTITVATDCAEDMTFDTDDFDLLLEVLVRAAIPYDDGGDED
jgi:hypothetical protein